MLKIAKLMSSVPRICLIWCRNMPRGKFNMDNWDKNDIAEFRQMRNENPEWFEDLEDVEETIFNEPNVVSKNANRLVKEQQRKFVKERIINKKYFTVQEPALLTWEAREQIRHLIENYPEEWTIDRLAESFPVSREAIIKVIKSNYRPLSLEQIYRYNQKVLKNWKRLDLLSGPVGLQTQKLILAGKTEILSHAVGIPKLPKPVEKYLVKREKKEKNDDRVVGKYEAIVKDYCESRKNDFISESNKGNEQYVKLISGQTEEMMKTVDKMSKRITNSKNLKKH